MYNDRANGATKQLRRKHLENGRDTIVALGASFIVARGLFIGFLYATHTHVHAHIHTRSRDTLPGFDREIRCIGEHFPTKNFR